MKKIPFVFGILLLFMGIFPSSSAQNYKADLNMLRKMQLVQLSLAELYVDTVNQAQLTESAIKHMLSTLDPHSTYSTPDETKKMTESLNGNFDGIGIQFNMLEDTILVVMPTKDGPSERAGLLAGDRIVKIDNKLVAGVKISRDSVMKLLRGPKSSIVELGISRDGGRKQFTVKVKRDKIPLYTLGAAYMLTPTVGYISLEQFGATSGREVRDAIAQLQKNGMRSLIFDLTNNGGGYLTAASEIAGQFLQENDLVVYTEGRSQDRQEMYASGNGLFREGQLIVLVNEYSASASEIVSGAIQDHERGWVVGRRTFGKGLVQRPIPLPDGSMIRLTTSYYYTPTGRCIQKPFVKGKTEDYGKDLEKRYNSGELLHKDSIHLDSSKVYKTLKTERIVYGGGGIMPDVFVPLDTTKTTPYYSKLRRSEVFNNTVLHYVDRHRKTITKHHATAESFIRDFVVPESLVEQLIADGKKQKVNYKDEQELQASLEDIRFSLKAVILSNLFDRTAFYRFLNTKNEILSAALKIIQ